MLGLMELGMMRLDDADFGVGEKSEDKTQLFSGVIYGLNTPIPSTDLRKQFSPSQSRANPSEIIYQPLD